ncbi:hypothetical protein [Saccharothrix variisporea]|uniref:Uncharacterized protein n=1 Tax=Saccharothrix variisporea TaxID=543527 RepID=A0A495X8N9_9PSEU|nr:hypothetical protein [Saccharothrix variisporea]RKT70362.1 hypothetical protein DFJ66_3622 [Saccharothrix variisporea]
MKPQDLSTVFHDHADLPETAHAVRMAGLHSRVRKVRRRRALVAMACALLVLVGGAVVTTRSVPDSQPAAPKPFPEYLLSSRVLAQASGTTPGPVTLRYTPTTPVEDLRLIFECAIGPEFSLDHEYLSVTLSIDGHAVGQPYCHPGATALWNEETRKWFRPGQESVVRLAVVGRTHETPTEVSQTPSVDPAPDGVVVRLAVGRQVPVSEYPLPPPPKEPVRLDRFLRSDADIVLRADPADPNREQKVVVPWRGIAQLHLWNGSPGRLRVVIGGVTVSDASNYQYTPGGVTGYAGYNPEHLVPGEPVEIEVVPEAVHGDWLVMLVEQD